MDIKITHSIPAPSASSAENLPSAEKPGPAKSLIPERWLSLLEDGSAACRLGVVSHLAKNAPFSAEQTPIIISYLMAERDPAVLRQYLRILRSLGPTEPLACRALPRIICDDFSLTSEVLEMLSDRTTWPIDSGELNSELFYALRDSENPAVTHAILDTLERQVDEQIDLEPCLGRLLAHHDYSVVKRAVAMLEKSGSKATGALIGLLALAQRTADAELSDSLQRAISAIDPLRSAWLVRKLSEYFPRTHRIQRDDLVCLDDRLGALGRANSREAKEARSELLQVLLLKAISFETTNELAGVRRGLSQLVSAHSDEDFLYRHFPSFLYALADSLTDAPEIQLPWLTAIGRGGEQAKLRAQRLFERIATKSAGTEAGALAASYFCQLNSVDSLHWISPTIELAFSLKDSERVRAVQTLAKLWEVNEPSAELDLRLGNLLTNLYFREDTSIEAKAEIIKALFVAESYRKQALEFVEDRIKLGPLSIHLQQTIADQLVDLLWDDRYSTRSTARNLIKRMGFSSHIDPSIASYLELFPDPVFCYDNLKNELAKGPSASVRRFVAIASDVIHRVLPRHRAAESERQRYLNLLQSSWSDWEDNLQNSPILSAFRRPMRIVMAALSPKPE